MKIRSRALAVCLAATAMTLAACSSESEDEPTNEAQGALHGAAKLGKLFFDEPLAKSNGRSCATCHVHADHTTLKPESVIARWEADPEDPLFHPIDADDPDAATPTYNHLKAGLVRVTLPLAANLDVVDAQGNVITNAARTISVWRSVPTVENTAFTGPYQLDGRAATLEEQAAGAARAHSQVKHPPKAVAKLIANYERTVFSSPAAAAVGAAIAAGQAPPNVEAQFAPGSAEAAGQALFQQGCAPCHGGPTTDKVTNQAVHDQLFPVINPDGSVDVAILPDGSPTPAHIRPDASAHQGVGIGIALNTYLGQIGVLPNFTGVDFPQYRIRFYTDAGRTQKVFDLPPPPPAISPTGFPMAFSVDPGRAILTGDPGDWEVFDIPQLRGVAHTAPYFHDNTAPDLRSVLDIYSRFVLSSIPQLHMPRIAPPELPGMPPEALTPEMKDQLIAYLNTL